MRKNLVSSVLVLSALLLPLAPAGAKITSQDLPRYLQVSENLYRGGQPSSVGIKRLKENGIKTIVSFRNNRKLTEAEETLAHREGLAYVNIPLDGIHKPTDKQISQFLAITSDQTKQPVFVHCQHGQDRTGVMCAIYREQNDKWTAHKAYAEAVKNGFHERYVWLADSVYDYAESIHLQESPRPIGVKLRDSFEHIISFFGSKNHAAAPQMVATETKENSAETSEKS